MSSLRVRFAPSPTGHLHVGNARTALFNWLLARHHGGTFILRIEDTDRERSTPAAEAVILEDLAWLGLTCDEGPGAGGAYGPYRQSERLALYHEHAGRLLAAGRAYHCFCPPAGLDAQRRAALAEGRPPKYAGTCRGIDPGESARRRAAGEQASVRFRVPDAGTVAFDDLIRGRVAFDVDVIGDPVLLRSDGHPAYNFAVVVDDALMAVTHVVRGEDHVSNTPRQLLLYEALGYPPPAFAHLSLVMGPDHSPLSKRHGATSVREFRERGYLPEALVNYLALIGWSPGGNDELLPVDELVRRFTLDAVGHSAGVFDERKLAWVNRHHLRAARADRLARLAAPYLAARGWVTAPDERGWRYLEEVVSAAAASIDRLEQVPDRLRFLFEFDPGAALAAPGVRETTDEPAARQVVEALAAELSGRPPLDRDAFRAAAAAIRDRTGAKGRALFHPIRVALTGEPSGLELDLALPAIDRGAQLGPGAGIAPIGGCRERAAAFAAVLRSGASAP